MDFCELLERDRLDRFFCLEDDLRSLLGTLANCEESLCILPTCRNSVTWPEVFRVLWETRLGTDFLAKSFKRPLKDFCWNGIKFATAGDEYFATVLYGSE